MKTLLAIFLSFGVSLGLFHGTKNLVKKTIPTIVVASPTQTPIPTINITPTPTQVTTSPQVPLLDQIVTLHNCQTGNAIQVKRSDLPNYGHSVEYIPQDCNNNPIYEQPMPNTYDHTMPTSALYAMPTPTPEPQFGSASSYHQMGNVLYGSDGSTYSPRGSTTVSNNGVGYHTDGNTMYGSDGTTYSQVGNNIYGSNGSNCSRVGSNISCSGAH